VNLIDTGTLVIKREVGVELQPWIKIPSSIYTPTLIKVDGLKSGSLRPGETIELTVPAGSHSVEVKYGWIRKSIDIIVASNERCTVYTSSNCLCDISWKPYLAKSPVIRDARCQKHLQGPSEFIQGLWVSFLFLCGIVWLMSDVSAVRFAIENHSFEIFKLVIQYHWLYAARMVTEPASGLGSFLTHAVFNSMAYGYCSITVLFVWHILHNHRLSLGRKLLWTVFTICSAPLFALVLPAAVYFVNHILLERKSPLCKLIAAVSALGVLLSLCRLLFSHDDYSLIAFMLFTPSFYVSFACAYSENADLLVKECLVPQVRAIFNHIRGTHDKTASTSENFDVESVHESPHLSNAASAHAVNAFDVEQAPLAQIGLDSEKHGSTIKVNDRVPEYRA
jgi:hypothetical protein